MKRLLQQLSRTGVSGDTITRLEKGLAFTDDTRHRRAVWAVVDALEATDRDS